MTVRFNGALGIFAGIILMSAIILAGCEKLDDLIDGGNSIPVVSNVTANPTTVETGDTVQLVAHAIDSDGDELKYAWSAPSGVFASLIDHSVQWTAPSVAGDVTISISVSDGKSIAIGSITVRVEEVYKEPPKNFKGTSGDQEVRLTWENPKANQFSKVVVRRSVSDFPGHTADGDSVYDGREEAFTDAGLVNDTRYYYAIFAEYGDGGYSDRETLSATPKSDLLPPAMPTGLRVEGTSVESISLRWNAVPQAVRYELWSDGTEIYNGADTSYTDTRLSGGTEYLYHVRASNAAGTSDWSAGVRGQTDLLLPETPSGLRVTGSTTGSISLNWDAVSGAERYELWRDGTEVYSGSSTSYTDTGLTDDTEHSYKARAKNAAGTSSWSTEVKGRTELSPPATSAGLRVAGTTTDSISLSWNAVPGADQYELWRDGVKVYSGSDTSYTDTGLVDDTEHSYKIRAKNAAGAGPWSAVMKERTELSPPATPEGLRVAGTTTDSISLSWNAVPGAERYELWRDGVEVYSGSDTSYTDTGLVDDMEHSYKLRARNTIEAGAWSVEVRGRTELAPPSVPFGLRIIETTANSIKLSWNSVHGTNMFELRRDGNNVYSVTGISYTDTELDDNTKYSYQVRSKNAAGVSEWSYEISERTKLAPPAIPAGLQVTGKTVDSISFAWNAVPEADSYELYRNGHGVVYSGSGTNHTDTKLDSDTNYAYKLRSINSADASAWTSLLYEKTDLGIPLPPAGLRVNSKTDSSIVLSWDAVSKADMYRLLRNNAKVYEGGDAIFTDSSGLSSGTAYSYTVMAHNSAGWSAESAPTTGWTRVAIPTLKVAETTTTSIKLTWNVVTGATKYDLYRNGTRIYFDTGTSHTDTGRSANTSYSYQIRSYGDHDNSSDLSNPPVSKRTLARLPTVSYIGKSPGATFVHTWSGGTHTYDVMDGVGHFALSRDGKSLYATNLGKDALIEFSRSTSNGTLSFVRSFKGGFDYTGDKWVDPGFINANAVAVSHDGSFVIVVGDEGSGDNEHLVYLPRNTSTGRLTGDLLWVDDDPLMRDGYEIAVINDDFYISTERDLVTKFWFTKATNSSFSYSSLFFEPNKWSPRIDISDGPITAFSGNSNSKSIYVGTEYDSAILGFNENFDSGSSWNHNDFNELTEADLKYIRDIEVHPYGKFLFATTESSIIVFNRNTSTGNISYNNKLSVSSKGDPILTTVSNDGKNLYVWHDDPGYLYDYAIDTDNGSLIQMNMIDMTQKVSSSDLTASHTRLNIKLSHDDKNIYVTGDDVIFIFSRRM